MATILDAFGLGTGDLTITMASLASDTSLLAGRSSAALDFTSTKPLNCLLQGFSTSGTSPTAGTIEWWLWWTVDGTNYPDAITGSDAAITMSSLGNKAAAMRLIGAQVTSTTSNAKYVMPPVDLLSWIGEMPSKAGIFVVHSMVAALNATGGNHKYTYQLKNKTVA